MMRANNLSQPDGCWLLTEFLLKAEEILVKNGYSNELTLYFKMGCINEELGDPQLERPSYNLVITYRGMPIFITQYELDRRFSLEISEEEIERVEDLMANETIAALGTFGLIPCINIKLRSNSMHGVLLKESEDKKFLPLN